VCIQGHGYTVEQARGWYEAASETHIVIDGKCLRFDDCPFPVMHIDGKVFQVADDRHLLFADGDQLYALETPASTENVAEGDAMQCVGVRAGAFSYIAVSGAQKQVPCYIYHPLMTYSEFLSAARNGELKRPVYAKAKTKMGKTGTSWKIWRRRNPPRLAGPREW